MGIFLILCNGYSIFLLKLKWFFIKTCVPHWIPVKHLQCTVAAQHNNNKATAWAKATTNTNGFRGGLWHLSCSNVYVHSSTEKHREKDGESLMRIQYICQNSCSFRAQCSPKPNEISYVAPLWTMGQIVTLTICIRTINWNVCGTYFLKE